MPATAIRKIREVLFASLGVEDRERDVLDLCPRLRLARQPAAVRRRLCQRPRDARRVAQGAGGRAGRSSSTGRSTTPATTRSRTTPSSTASSRGSRPRPPTMVWLPAFFSMRMQGELGKLVILDHLLRGDNLDQHAQHLSLQDRLAARPGPGEPGQMPWRRAPAGAGRGLRHRPRGPAGDARRDPRARHPLARPELHAPAARRRHAGPGAGPLARPGPGTPVPRPSAFRARGPKKADCEKVLAEVQRAAGADDRGVEVDRAVRPAVKLVANPSAWATWASSISASARRRGVTHFNRQLAAAAKKRRRRPRELRRLDGPAPAEGPVARGRQPADPRVRRADQPEFRLRGLPVPSRPG